MKHSQYLINSASHQFPTIPSTVCATHTRTRPTQPNL